MFEVYHRNYVEPLRHELNQIKTACLNIDGRSWVILHVIEDLFKNDLRVGGDEGVNLDAYRTAFRKYSEEYERTLTQAHPSPEPGEARVEPV